MDELSNDTTHNSTHIFDEYIDRPNLAEQKKPSL